MIIFFNIFFPPPAGIIVVNILGNTNTFSIIRILTSVDRLLNPANRAHMSLEEQLRELLEKLDLTCAMKSSGSRSKRAKLLKKEISIIRNKLSQQHNQAPQIESGIGSFEEEGAALEQDGEEEGKILNHV